MVVILDKKIFHLWFKSRLVIYKHNIVRWLKLGRSFFIDTDKIVFRFSILYILVLGEAYFKSDSTAIVIYILRRGKSIDRWCLIGALSNCFYNSSQTSSILPYLLRDPREKNGISGELFRNYQMAKKKSGENFFEEIMREMEFNAKYLIFFSNYNYIGNSKTKELRITIWYIIYCDGYCKRVNKKKGRKKF